MALANLLPLAIQLWRPLAAGFPWGVYPRNSIGTCCLRVLRARGPIVVVAENGPDAAHDLLEQAGGV